LLFAMVIDVGRFVGGVDFALVSDHDALLVFVRAFDSAFDLDVLLGFLFAIVAQGRAEHRHAFTGCVAHNSPNWCFRRLTRSAA
jgi:hypothetical protein